MDKKTIIIFNESENLLKGSASVISIIHNHLSDLLKKHNCCNDLVDKSNGYSELYNDIIARYNNLLKQAKNTKNNNIKISNEIFSLHKFIKMLHDDLFSLDKKIMERSIELLKYTNKEEGMRNLKRCMEIIYTKLNLFRLMKPDTNLFESEMTLKVEFPFKVTKNIVDKLIKLDNDDNPSLRMLYI